MLAHSPFAMLTVSVAPLSTSIASALVGCGEKPLQFWLLVTVNVTARNGSAASSARPTMANDKTVGFFMRACSRKGVSGILGNAWFGERSDLRRKNVSCIPSKQDSLLFFVVYSPSLSIWHLVLS